MNIIIDPKLAARLESIRLHPGRVFVCKPCERTTDRNGVHKENGVYYCLICGKPVSVLNNGNEAGGTACTTPEF